MDLASWFQFLLEAVYLFLPAYAANMAPVGAALLLRKRFSTPVDNGSSWRGKRVFGDHKTWRGLVSGVIAGVVVFWIQKRLAGLFVIDALSILDYHGLPVIVGGLIGLGALLGDLAKSFFKRRVGVDDGKSWFPFDQLDFIVGGLAVILFFATPPWQVVVCLVVMSFFLTFIVGSVSMGLKRKGNGEK